MPWGSRAVSYTHLLLVDVLSVNDKIAKIGLSVLVVILNYVLSKLLIFRKKRAQ